MRMPSGYCAENTGTKLQALRVGEGAIRRSLQAQLKMLKEDAPILGTLSHNDRGNWHPF
jgi:hypothetical protein